MSMDAKRVIDEALRLPADIRAALAGELLASLDDSELESDRDAAWSTEIRDRIDAYERGDVTAVPAEQALAPIRAVRDLRSCLPLSKRRSQRPGGTWSETSESPRRTRPS